jgi:hypothetical protein
LSFFDHLNAPQGQMAAQKGDANDRIIQNELAAVWLKHNNVEIQMVRRRSERILIAPFVLFV